MRRALVLAMSWVLGVTPNLKVAQKHCCHRPVQKTERSDDLSSHRDHRWRSSGSQKVDRAIIDHHDSRRPSATSFLSSAIDKPPRCALSLSQADSDSPSEQLSCVGHHPTPTTSRERRLITSWQKITVKTSFRGRRNNLVSCVKRAVIILILNK